MLSLFLLATVGIIFAENVVQTNERLRATNSALLAALREMTEVTSESRVGQSCLTQPPAAECQGNTLVTYVGGTMDASGCMKYGRSMIECPAGLCNAAEKKCDDSPSGGAILCGSNINQVWACIECDPTNAGKACQAKKFGGGLVSGVCNDQYGCMSQTKEEAVGAEYCVWTKSGKGKDLKSGQWSGSGSTSYQECAERAVNTGVKFFAWTSQVYNGFCKVLKADVVGPDFSTYQGYGYVLYERLCFGAATEQRACESSCRQRYTTYIDEKDCKRAECAALG